MEIKVSESVIETVCNSLRASKQSLRSQLSRTTEETKKAVLEHQFEEVKEALAIFEKLL